VDIENMDIMGKVLGNFLEKGRVKGKKKSGMVITHTGYILEYIRADKGYILIDGTIVCSGDPYQIFKNIQENGFRECATCNI
jgi:Fe-S cluster assembly ATP-binding protein